MTGLALGFLSRTPEVGARNITSAVVYAQDNYEVSSPDGSQLTVVLV
jgi:hypothetical protein